jgi:hypothetical protein
VRCSVFVLDGKGFKMEEAVYIGFLVWFGEDRVALGA